MPVLKQCPEAFYPGSVQNRFVECDTDRSAKRRNNFTGKIIVAIFQCRDADIDDTTDLISIQFCLRKLKLSSFKEAQASVHTASGNAPITF